MRLLFVFILFVFAASGFAQNNNSNSTACEVKKMVEKVAETVDKKVCNKLPKGSPAKRVCKHVSTSMKEGTEKITKDVKCNPEGRKD